MTIFVILTASNLRVIKQNIQSRTYTGRIPVVLYYNIFSYTWIPLSRYATCGTYREDTKVTRHIWYIQIDTKSVYAAAAFLQT